ncbi:MULTISPECIES: type III-A CRISPR-associated RAMP protein Csm4 [unclassified Desulfovibrio]|uniref:type III-A CRISPR-associated RAMP protein Csm4 n=1 Tax=unclassified Desulfovibrio TaxID=2593640 RepID=UPI000F5E0B1B|nr:MULTISPECIES: hypothetical protein [unclassified Desulfovibrio]RRD69419.1 hypothetical protein EII24_10250 [Desulfovibrio sp. OH1209_COT-279]RRD86115.1 hypothetical protein EII23_10250 [Desulfovibrio sp. OH1186_COT-070]
MSLHRYILRPLSPWGTPLRSDTLYGLVLWRIAEQEGDAACRDVIAAFRAGTPPFILSSAMPAETIFAPRLPPAPRALFRQWVEEGAFRDATGNTLPLAVALRAYKKFRKRAYLPTKLWTEHAGALSIRSIFAWHCMQPEDGDGAPLSVPGVEPHVTVSRSGGGALEGGLFFSNFVWFATDAALHLYARTNDPERLLALLRLVGDMGFGKDAAVGKGRFAVDRDDLPAVECTGESALLLSVCAAPDMAGTSGWYTVEIKRGKLGPGPFSPFKSPVLLLQEGSVLRTLPQGPYVLENIHSNPAIVQITHPLTLPCSIREEG